MQIIGITGTIGAGKGTIVEYLMSHKGFLHLSVRDYLAQQLTQQGLPINRDTLTHLGNYLRATYSPSYIAEELYKKALASKQHCVIESLRAPGEILALKRLGNFVLFAVDAEVKTRYERIVLRKSATDNISFDTFVHDEQREMNSNDPNKQNLSACIQLADHVFFNNGDINELYQQVDKWFNEKAII